jgi:nitrogen fixation NifU-like protein
MVTEMAKGKTLEGAKKITRQDVADSLDGLPPPKCIVQILLRML